MRIYGDAVLSTPALGNRIAPFAGMAAKSRMSRGGGSQGSAHGNRVTTDHDEIQDWADERGAHPACVTGTGRGGREIGTIRLEFPGYSGGESLEPITWEEWFEVFEEDGLAFVYQEATAGQRSNFNKLIKRSGDEEEEE